MNTTEIWQEVPYLSTLTAIVSLSEQKDMMTTMETLIGIMDKYASFAALVARFINVGDEI